MRRHKRPIRWDKPVFRHNCAKILVKLSHLISRQMNLFLLLCQLTCKFSVLLNLVPTLLFIASYRVDVFGGGRAMGSEYLMENNGL